tara:strand:- start:130 stop:393 length:264 start_codon:yes stop_codon:yes gene_type:complete
MSNIKNDIRTIHAFSINNVHITIKCPHHKKKTFHRHGSCGDISNREEPRCSHCTECNYNNVIIDDQTLRCDLGKRGQPLKRSFQYYI